MQEESKGLVEAMQALWGGALTSLIAALVGRLMWHGSEVRAGRRSIFGWALLWEFPVAFGMALMGEGLASYFDLKSPSSTAVIAFLAYLGPRGSQELIKRFIERGKPK